MTTRPRLPRARRPLAALALCMAVATGACVPTLPRQPREPDTRVPSTFPGATDTGSRSTAAVQWREFFTDPNLSSLIEEALTNNRELSIVGLEVDIAKYEIMARRGEYLPRLDVRAGAGIEKVGRHTSQGVADEVNEVPEHLQDYLFGFFASWEVDVWKKLRNATKAATLRYLSSIEGKRFLTTRLVAEVANSYYELLALDSQLQVVQQNLAIQEDALESVRVQKEAARVTELAVKRFEAEVLKNRSRQYAIQQQIVGTENRLNFLAGRYPQHIQRSTAGFAEMVPAMVREGIPSQLLQNRPDVHQAELELAAAKLDVEVARARFYPSLEIRGGIGYQTYEVQHFVDTPASLLYRLFGELTAPLFNRKALTADYYSANARQMQAVLGYEQTVLKAFGEVSTQLSMIENLEHSYDLRAQEVERLNQSIVISTNLFQSARADYVEVLLTRREALESQIELIETKKNQLAAMVNLYQALGGGWD